MTGTVEYESTSLPLIVYLLYNVVLVTALYPFFGRDGYENKLIIVDKRLIL